MIAKLTAVTLTFVLFMTAIAGYFVVIIQGIQGAHLRILGGIVPEQVHLSSTGDPTEMVVMWTTFHPTDQSAVQYNEYGVDLTNNVTGKMVKFVDGGGRHVVRYMHTVTLTGLEPATQYDYKVGCSDKWSDTFTMTTLNNGTDWSPRLAIYGDMGSTNAQSLSRLIDETNAGHFDAILHIGDYAYDLASVDGLVGDEFMNSIQDIATKVPYMTAPGNHEAVYNFSHYINRFKMPGGHSNYYYSWDVGHAHFIVFSTEVYFFPKYGVELIEQQYKWLEQDLKEVNSRKNRPWVITAGHRPMYCSTKDRHDCNSRDSMIRTGYTQASSKAFALEPLFYDYGVDIELWAHEHEYQRMWPVYNRTVYNGSDSEPYVDPKAPVHVITGSAGCKERHVKFTDDPMPWDAARYLDYGYSHLTVINSTHIKWQQISDDQNGKIVDEIYIKRTKGYPSWLQ
ncbi:acid phosphatase type 7-like [Dysidea avara]|uniref:acid phosphatase type 7-like n=1 Tax=Dysidea avara TaxID=196820 RepID=UPI003328CF18